MAELIPRDLSLLEAKIGYQFHNRGFLRQALTHSSVLQEQNAKLMDYERLEFLGDAVLEAVSSEYLYHHHPDWPEGQLTRRRAQMVCENALAYVARLYGFGDWIVFGHGEEKTGGRTRPSILCDVTEAIIGAVYLDSAGQGNPLQVVKTLIERMILCREDELVAVSRDNKSRLQELVQARGTEAVEYAVISTEGAPHDRTFGVEARYGGKTIGWGKGHSKKEAEQQAAAMALEAMQSEDKVWN